MNVKVVSITDSPEILIEVLGQPAVFVNHFHLMGGHEIIRMTVGETPDLKNVAYRGAYVMNVDSARQLAKLLSEAVIQAETQAQAMALAKKAT